MHHSSTLRQGTRRGATLACKLSHRQRQRRQQLAQTFVESLETRQLLAVTWDGGGDGTNWSDPANWSNDQLPGINDDVVLNIAANPTVEVNDGVHEVRSISSFESIVLNVGALVPSLASTFNAPVTLNGGAIGGAGDITLSSGFTFNGGELAGAGKLVLPAGTTSLIDTATTKVIARAIDVSGNLHYDGDAVYFGNSSLEVGTINVNSGGAFRIRGDGGLYVQYQIGNAINVHSGGTFRRASGEGIAVVDIAVNIVGAASPAPQATVEAASGRLSLRGGGTWDKYATATSGTGTLGFDTGVFTLSASRSGFHAGTGGTSINGATLNLVTAAGPLAFSVAGPVSLESGTVAGSGSMFVPGGLTWSGGTMEGTGLTTVGGSSFITTSVNKILARALTVGSGTLDYQGDAVYFGNASGEAGVLTAQSGGTLKITGDGGFYVNYALNNSINVLSGGTLHRSAGSGTVVIDVALNVNTSGAPSAEALVHVAAGRLSLRGGGNWLQWSSAANGTGTLGFDAGTFTLANMRSSLSGINGLTSIAGATVLLAAGITPAWAVSGRLDFSSGTIGGAGHIFVLHGLDWTGGTLEGTGTATIGGASTIDEGTNKILARRLVVTGSLAYSGDGVYFGNAAGQPGILDIADGGAFNITGDGGLYVNYALDNEIVVVTNGTLQKTLGNGTSNVQIPLRLEGGAVNATSGTLALLGGSGEFASGGGQLNATSPGRLSFNGGVFNLAGNYTSSGNGVVAFEGASVVLAAGATYASPATPIELRSGSLGGAGTITPSGGFTWLGGALEGTGKLVVPADRSFNVGTLGTKILAMTIDVAGIISDGGDAIYFGNAFGEPGVINVLAGGEYTFLGSSQLIINYAIAGQGINVRASGQLIKTGAASTSGIGIPLHNAGTIEVVAGGLNVSDANNLGAGAFLSGGRYIIHSGAAFGTGHLVQTLTADVEIRGSGSFPQLAYLEVNRGRVALDDGADLALIPSSGIYTQEGILDLSPGSNLSVAGAMRFAGTSQPIIRTEIASAGLFGRVTVTGALDLNSPDSAARLDPDLVNNYNPAVNSHHNVIIANGGITNAFDGFFGGSTPGGNTLILERPSATVVSVGVRTGAAPPAPVLQSQTYEYKTREAIVFQFSQDVSAFLSRKDYRIRNVGTNLFAPQSAGVLSFNQTSNQAVLTLTGFLPDGVYELTVQASDIANAAGVPLTNGTTINFHVLRGDADHDRDVDFDDLLTLSQNYGQAGRDYAGGNFDYSADGLVSFDDLLALAQNYSKSLTLAAVAGPVKKPAAASRRSAASII